MGILDEAIREHLELKRRVGADAAEVARLEREAFGAGDPPAAAPDDAAQAPEPDLEVAPAPPEPEPAAEAEPEPAPAPVEPAPAPPETVAVEQPTRQFTAQELADAAPAEAEPGVDAQPAEPGEHDELEETPDFLQETPEHDRLWFEQKPPKDFDF